MKNNLLYKRLVSLFAKYERIILPFALLCGLVTDFLAVRFLNLTLVLTILCIHVFLSGAMIIVLNLPEVARDNWFLKYLKIFAPLILYYSFGAMLSMFFVLYTSSGSFFSSFLFFALITFLMVSIEIFRERLKDLRVQLFIYTVAVFSYVTLALPYVMRRIGDDIFVAGSLLVVIYGIIYLLLLKKLTRALRGTFRRVVAVLIAVAAGIQGLYFFNIIPPFPLSLRESGFYHSIYLDGGVYRAQAEERPFWNRVSPVGVVYIQPGQRTLSYYSSVFAPARISTDVSHRWRRYEEGKFVTRSIISYPITGGRFGGYRGYTTSGNIEPGLWWITVEVGRGRVVGGSIVHIVEDSQRASDTQDIVLE